AAAGDLAGAAAEREVAARVSREQALAFVRELVALGPRMGGTPSGDRAAESVARRLAALGLSVERIDDPETPFHVEHSWSASLPEGSLPSAWPYGFSPSLPESVLPLALPATLEVPPGPGHPAAGAAVIVPRRSPGAYARAVERGARAVLVDPGEEPGRFTDWAPILELPEGEGRAPIPVFAFSARDGRRLREAAGRPEPSVTLSLRSTIGKGRPRTVLATLPGAGARGGEIILVCAHGDSDSGGPGADDNASGVAALVEVARALSWAAAAGLLPGSRPAVRFAVWGAEIHSSRAYAASRPGEMARHAAVINYDQAGTGAERDALYYEGNDVPWNEPLLRTLEQVARDHAGEPGFWAVHTSVPTLGGTDAYVFLPREHKGMGIVAERIPSTTIYTSAWDAPTLLDQTPGWTSAGWPERGKLFVDYSKYYHSSGDRPEVTTEAEPYNMERCARLAALGIMRLMGSGPAGQKDRPVRDPVPPR
ncbi:MAG TPA: M28 family peptidase, partial [Candidatus Polarisedimenticolia bacterium]|nr:M28 family peptidase [Candidatus Polarisedimenticolia bacterium]